MDYMARALQLASRALGSSSPNPAVGAVLVRDGEVVGEGATQPPGQAHAEVMALQAAGECARGSTLYVTLEPCAHHGRTPPCADALVAAGVSSVHVAMLDPSPWVNGQGVATLQAAGIEVQRGSHEQEARRLNEAYLTWVQRGRPLVTALYALTLDGRAVPLSEAQPGAAATVEFARLRGMADRTVTAIEALLVQDPDLTGLAAEGVTALHVEASPGALVGLAARGLLDRAIVLLTPTLHLDPRAAAPTGLDLGMGGEPLGLPARSVTYERLGEAVLITAEFGACGGEDAEAATKPAQQPAEAETSGV